MGEGRAVNTARAIMTVSLVVFIFHTLVVGASFPSTAHSFHLSWSQRVSSQTDTTLRLQFLPPSVPLLSPVSIRSVVHPHKPFSGSAARRDGWPHHSRPAATFHHHLGPSTLTGHPWVEWHFSFYFFGHIVDVNCQLVQCIRFGSRTRSGVPCSRLGLQPLTCSANRPWTESDPEHGSGCTRQFHSTPLCCLPEEAEIFRYIPSFNPHQLEGPPALPPASENSGVERRIRFQRPPTV